MTPATTVNSIIACISHNAAREWPWKRWNLSHAFYRCLATKELHVEGWCTRRSGASDIPTDDAKWAMDNLDGGVIKGLILNVYIHNIVNFESYNRWPPTTSSSTRFGVRNPTQNPNLKFRTEECWWRNNLYGGPKFLGFPRLCQELQAADFKCGRYIQRVHRNKSPLELIEKRERERIHRLPNILGTPIISETGKAAHFKFCKHIHRVDVNKSRWKNWENTRWRSPDIFRAPIYKAYRSVIFAIAQLFCETNPLHEFINLCNCS